LKLSIQTLLRIVAGTYFVLTSIYCLLAFLPYTFYFLIKAPPYAWMPWFVQHQAGLYALAAVAIVASNWLLVDSWKKNAWGKKDWRQFSTGRFWSGFVLLMGAEIFLVWRPFLATLQDNRSAYAWSLAALLPLAVLALWKPHSHVADAPQADANDKAFAYSGGLLIALVVSAVSSAGARIQTYHDNGSLRLHAADAEFSLWSLLSHLALAVVVLSIINLIFVLAAKTAKPQAVRRGAVGTFVFGTLCLILLRFLESSLSFGGWEARCYAAALAFGTTLWGFSLVSPFLESREVTSAGLRKYGVWGVLVIASGLLIGFPFLIGGADWSGFLQSTVTLFIWITVSVCIFYLRPARVAYSAATVMVVLLASAAIYESLVASKIFWSHPLGSTDDEILLSLEAYAGHDNSFQLAHHILGNGRGEVCGDLCRILREYTNIRDTQARADVQLVDNLTATAGPKPNIFVFVIDSMRPDYLGPYNPRVNYTPNLDALARDGIVLHRAYSQYAGTSLSEPTIWSGAMMLHAHYVQPFERLNSLDRMLHADHYRMLVSMDEILSIVLPADDDVVKLDTDKKLWNSFELGSTLRQAEQVLNATPESTQPIFLYAQPKNVHQFARNDVPSPTSQHWQGPEGLNPRITYEVHWVDSCLGEFIAYLKQRGLYDNSIIVVTSDHGDATGEFGRVSHSTLIWPEVMHVPLIIHLPQKMREHVVYDDSRISTLTDIAPTLYYLLGHRPIRQNPLYGRPLLTETKEELESYPDKDLLLASDIRAVYGILTADGRYLYTTYDSPAQSYLFDLSADPNALHDILTPSLKQRYDEEIIEHLHMIGNYYGYKPGVGSLLASSGR
jgi:hypothetical protein